MHCLTKKVGSALLNKVSRLFTVFKKNVGSALFILNQTFNFRGSAPYFIFILNQTFNFRGSAPYFMFILNQTFNFRGSAPNFISI